MKTKILATGLTGLVGSRIKELLSGVYDFEELGRAQGVDILDKNSVEKGVLSSDASIVLHLAAKTHVDGCEEDKDRDKEALELKSEEDKEVFWRQEKTAWAVNVIGTRNIIEACKKSNKKIIYISTDFVFDGTKHSYSEEDKPGPVNWYAKTKYEGEKLVESSGLSYLIIRIAYPYRALFEKKDFVRALLDKLSSHQPLSMVTDHIMVPTFIDDFANALDVLIQKDEQGIFHVVGSQSITPYDAALKIAEIFGLDNSTIEKTTRREYFAGKAPRPFCLNLKNAKIAKLGIEMLTFEAGVREVKSQLDRINS